MNYFESSSIKNILASKYSHIFDAKPSTLKDSLNGHIFPFLCDHYALVPCQLPLCNLESLVALGGR